MPISKNSPSIAILVVLFLVCVVIKRSNGGTIIAKSDLTICDSYDNNPHNVVDNKSCQKKLIITQSVLSSQDGTETLLFTTNKIYDRLEKEEARLYNPFILKISKSTVNLVYPFYYEKTVNNHPFEELRKDTACNDAYNADATCDFARDPKGEKIWDSQGFCCQCTIYENVPRWLRTILYGGHANTYYRGGQQNLCGYSHTSDWDNDKYSHCMRMDDLWYDVFSIGDYRLSFVIKIQAYDQVNKIVNNKTVTEWVDGGKINLSYRKKSAVGQYGRLVATFHGTFLVTEEFQTFKDHYFLLIPSAGDVDPDHVQLKGGYRDYMIIPSNLISLVASHDNCDMVGVSYSSFRKLGGGSNAAGPGCQQKMESCFNNQPKDLFDADLTLREVGKRPNYFVERYGNCIGVNKKGPSETLGIVYQLDKTITSLLTLEVSADDMILIYNKATGSIVKSFATNFDALSRDGKMTVMIQNTGLVSSDFYVVFASCSEGVHLNEERTASINPKQIKIFKYNIEVYHRKGQRHYCTIELYNSRREIQDSKNVTFKTFTPCVCLQHCKCTCNQIGVNEDDGIKEDDEKADCSDPDDEDDDFNDDEDKSEKSIVGKTLDYFFSLLKGEYLVLIVMILLGILKASLGRQSLAIAKLGWGGIRFGEKITKKINGKEVELVFNASMDLVDPETEKTLIPNNPDWDFYRNLVFFFLLPIMLAIKIVRLFRGSVSKLQPKPKEEHLPLYATRPGTTKETSDNVAPKSKRIVPKIAVNTMKKNRFGLARLTANAPKLKKSSPKKSK